MLMHGVTFFVDELLWLMTWGWYQLALGVVFTWFMFVLMGRMKLLSALLLTIGSYAFAIFVYFIFVTCILINFFQWKFLAGGQPNVYGAFNASLILACILSVFQCLFYYLINYRRRFYVIYFFILSLISNILAAVCSSFFIKLSF